MLTKAETRITRVYPIAIPEFGGRKARSAQFSPAGTQLATATGDGAGKLYQCYGMFGDRPELREVPLPQVGNWQGFAFRPQPVDGAGENKPLPELAVATGNRIARFRCRSMLQDWQPLPDLPMPGANSVSYSADGQLLISGGHEGLLKLWVLFEDSVEEMYCARVSGTCITAVAVGHLSDMVYFVTADGDCFRHTGGDGGPASLKEKDEGSYGLPSDWDCLCLASHPSKPFVLFGGAGNVVWLHNAANDNLSVLRTGLGGFIRKASIQRLGQITLIGECGVELWNLDRLQRTQVYQAESGERVLAARQFLQSLYVVVG